MNEGALFELPRGWVWTRLGEIVNVTSGYGFPKKYQGKAIGEIPFFKVSDISKSVLNGHMFLKFANNYISKKDCKEIRANPLRKGTIVFAKIGEAIKLNRRAILEQDSLVDNNVMGIYPYNETLDNLFAFFFLSTIKLGDYSRSTTVPSVRKSDVEQISIPFPPLPEQRAIVSKIEQLFSDLDNGIENFKKAQEQLKIYRQAVLKNACEGKLVPTEAELARAEGRDYEPADVLLARILKERREKWNGKGKYKEPVAPDTSGLSELPKGWVWANVRIISEKIQYGTSEKAGEDNSGIPVLRMGNIQGGKLNLDKLKYFPIEWSELNDYILQDGDVLFNRTNSAELVGKTSVYKKHHLQAVFASYLIRVKVIENVYNPDLLSFFINSIFGRKYIGSVVSQQVGQANVNGTKLSQMPIPLPPIAEQHRIVTDVERRLSICDNMEATITESLQKAESLRQSILKKAFEGKLLNEKELEEVRNAPDWETAEKLLERIKAEKTNIITKKKGKK